MNIILGAVRRQLSIISGTAMVWVALFKFNNLIFATLSHSPEANWVFLPAGLRLLVVLMFGEAAAAGLAVGAFVTLLPTSISALPFDTALAASSGIAPFTAVWLGSRILQIPRSLAGLLPAHIICLSVLCAATNAALVNGLMWVSERLNGDFEQIATVFFGDVAGALIVLLILSALLASALPRTPTGT